MANVYLTTQLVASVEASQSSEEAVPAIGRVAMKEALERIESFLSAPSAEGLLELEEQILQLSGRLSGALTAFAAEAACRLGAYVPRTKATAQDRGPWRHKGFRDTDVRFMGGFIYRFHTPYLVPVRLRRRGRRRGVGRRGRSGCGCYPNLELFGIRYGATPALQSAVARQVVRGASFEEARDVFLEQGNAMNVKTIRRIALAVGDGALAQRQARVEASQAGAVYTNEFAEQRVVIGVDGGRVRIREGGERGRRRPNGHRGFHANWREPKLFSVYVINEKGRPIRNIPSLYEATMGGPKKTFELLVAELKLRGIADAKEIIVVTDGASWIWNRSAELPSLLGVSEDKVTRVADFYHAIEHLQAIADSRNDWASKDVKRWVKTHKRFLLQGRVEKVIADVRGLRRSRNRNLIRREVAYFQRLKPFMHYNFYRDHAIPIGSGAVESAIRRVVNLRLKGPGIFWKRETVEKMLHLRAYLKASRWNELMCRVIHASPDGHANSSGAPSIAQLKIAA